MVLKDAMKEEEVLQTNVCRDSPGGHSVESTLTSANEHMLNVFVPSWIYT